MSEAELRALLDDEIKVWSKKAIAEIIADLQDPHMFNYERGERLSWHQFEFNLLENTGTYLHVGAAIDDGSPELSRSPVCSSFIIHRDGRVELTREQDGAAVSARGDSA